MKMRRVTIIAVLVLVIVGAVSIASVYNLHYQQNGIIEGTISIGPLCPVEPCQMPQSNIYTSKAVVLQPLLGSSIYISLKYDGGYHASVPAGTYNMNLTNCTYIGCARVLPKSVKIKPFSTTVINISIDTGIR